MTVTRGGFSVFSDQWVYIHPRPIDEFKALLGSMKAWALDAKGAPFMLHLIFADQTRTLFHVTRIEDNDDGQRLFQVDIEEFPRLFLIDAALIPNVVDTALALIDSSPLDSVFIQFKDDGSGFHVIDAKEPSDAISKPDPTTP